MKYIAKIVMALLFSSTLLFGQTTIGPLGPYPFLRNVDITIGAVTDDKASLAVKPSVTVVATSNTALSGLLTIDGVITAAGSIVLATAQTTGSQNGPWVVASGAWTRPTWYASGNTTQAFQFITTFARLGTVNAGSIWRLTSPSGVITVDTTSTTWTLTLYGTWLLLTSGGVLLNPTTDQTILGTHKLINQGSELTGDALAGFDTFIQAQLVSSSFVAITGASLNHSPFNIGFQGIAQGVGAYGGYTVASYDATVDTGQTPTGFQGDSIVTSTVNYSAGPTGIIGTATTKPAVATTMAFGIGVYGGVVNTGAGTITALTSVQAGTNGNTGGGTVTKNYGFDALLQSVGATNAAFHSVDQGSGANNYGILLDGVTHNDLGGGVTKVGNLLDAGLSASLPVCTDGSKNLVTTGCPVAPNTTANPGWWGSGDGSPFSISGSPSGQWGTGTANEVKVWMVRIPFTIAIRKLTYRHLSSLVGAKGAFGMYNSTGTTKLFSWDAFSLNVGAGTITTTLGATVTLSPGIYIVACGVDTTGTAPTTLGGYSAGNTNEGVLPWNTNGTVRTGVAANPLVASSLPATLGVIAPGGGGFSVLPLVVMEP